MVRSALLSKSRTRMSFGVETPGSREPRACSRRHQLGREQGELAVDFTSLGILREVNFNTALTSELTLSLSTLLFHPSSPWLGEPYLRSPRAHLQLIISSYTNRPVTRASAFSPLYLPLTRLSGRVTSHRSPGLLPYLCVA